MKLTMAKKLKFDRLSHAVERVPLKARLATLVGLALAGALLLAITTIPARWEMRSQVKDLSRLAELAVKIDSFIHEAQKERGATGTFVGSSGKTFGPEVASQRKLTDERRADLKSFLAQFDAARFGPEFIKSFDAGVAEIQKLDAHRAAVDKLTVDKPTAIGFYTNMNVTLLTTIESISTLSSDAAMSRELAAYVNFSQAKERAGQERATMTTVFATDKFEGNFFNQFSATVTAQQTYFSVFQAFASPEHYAFYQQTVTGKPVEEINAMRAAALKLGPAAPKLGIDSKYWFDQTTARINMMKQVEDRLATDLTAHANALNSQANTALGWLGALVIGASTIAIGGGLLVMTSISRPIARLANAAQGIARGDIQQKVDVRSSDEIGAMGLAFKEMIAYLSEMASTANTIAAGNLSVSVQPKSERDAQGVAFQEMTESLGTIAGVAEQIAAGNLSVRVQPKSEHDSLGLAFQEMIESLSSIARVAEQIAAGDLTVQVQPKSERDVLGNAFAGMVRMLHTAMTETRTAATALGEAKDQLAQVAEEAARATQEVARASSQVAEGTSQQAQAV